LSSSHYLSFSTGSHLYLIRIEKSAAGVGELEESKLETLLEIKYSDVFNAVQTLGKGDVGKVRKLFLDFQKNLYLPHKEYQRVS